MRLVNDQWHVCVTAAVEGFANAVLIDGEAQAAGLALEPDGAVAICHDAQHANVGRGTVDASAEWAIQEEPQHVAQPASGPFQVCDALSLSHPISTSS